MNGRRRSVLVTGAARGIGRAVAQRLSKEGHEVIAVDLDNVGLSQLQAEPNIEIVNADLTVEADLSRVVEAGSAVDGLVAAAGILRFEPVSSPSSGLWDEVLRVNATSTFLLLASIGPTMPRGGAIVTVSSIAARLSGTAETAAYSASKSAVISITHTMASVLAPSGVRVNSVCPGIIESPMQDTVNERLSKMRDLTSSEVAQTRLAPVPLQRAGTVHEVASAIIFLLSENASYITGQSLNVDGGWVKS